MTKSISSACEVKKSWRMKVLFITNLAFTSATEGIPLLIWTNNRYQPDANWHNRTPQTWSIFRWGAAYEMTQFGLEFQPSFQSYKLPTASNSTSAPPGKWSPSLEQVSRYICQVWGWEDFWSIWAILRQKVHRGFDFFITPGDHILYSSSLLVKEACARYDDLLHWREGWWLK